jgi:hypothetical protein
MRNRRRYLPRVRPGAGLSTSEAKILIAWLERMAEAVWLHHRDAIQAHSDMVPPIAPIHTMKTHHDAHSESDGPLWTDDEIPF